MSESDVEALKREMSEMRGALRFAQLLLTVSMTVLTILVGGFGLAFWNGQAVQHDALIKLIQKVDDLDGSELKTIAHDLDELKTRVSTLESKH